MNDTRDPGHNESCRTCDGEGRVHATSSDPIRETVPCPECRGSGLVRIDP